MPERIIFLNRCVNIESVPGFDVALNSVTIIFERKLILQFKHLNLSLKRYLPKNIWSEFQCFFISCSNMTRIVLETKNSWRFKTNTSASVATVA